MTEEAKTPPHYGLPPEKLGDDAPAWAQRLLDEIRGARRELRAHAADETMLRQDIAGIHQRLSRVETRVLGDTEPAPAPGDAH